MKFRLRWNARMTAGLIIGILTPIIAIPLVMWIIALVQNWHFVQLWHLFKASTNAKGKFISLAIIPNLGWFYFFLNRERYDIARGIIVGSACYLPFVIYTNFFV